MVEEIGRAVGCPRAMVPMPPAAGWVAAKLVGWAVGDVVLTRDEIAGLVAGLLHADAPPAGGVRLADWLAENRTWLGTSYMSELARRVS